MAKLTHHHNHRHAPWKKWAVVATCAGLFGAALIADFFWASSSATSAYLSLASNWARQRTGIIVLPTVPSQADEKKVEEAKPKEDRERERFLSATFADIPAPEWKWEEMPAAPVPRLDGAAIQIENLLYVFAGYGTLDWVHSHVDVYNFTNNTWGGRFDMPKEMAHSHLGMATDGRYIYIVSGQYGPQCRGPVAHTFILDTKTKKWSKMPPLPAP
ncbi:hypothetical protein CRG98_045943, partial [Punica granatum]